jgi:hypothetical protein
MSDFLYTEPSLTSQYHTFMVMFTSIMLFIWVSKSAIRIKAVVQLWRAVRNDVVVHIGTYLMYMLCVLLVLLSIMGGMLRGISMLIVSRSLSLSLMTDGMSFDLYAITRDHVLTMLRSRSKTQKAMMDKLYMPFHLLKDVKLGKVKGGDKFELLLTADADSDFKLDVYFGVTLPPPPTDSKSH